MGGELYVPARRMSRVYVLTNSHESSTKFPRKWQEDNDRGSPTAHMVTSENTEPSL